MTRKTLIAAAALALAAAAPTFAAEGFHPVIGATFTGGGKTLVSVEMTDGSSQRVSSGGLIHMFGGVEYRAAESPLTFQGTVGYHVDDTSADNGSVSFSRVPFELLAFWNTDDKLRFGAGLRKATGAQLNSSGAASALGDVNMRSSLGFVLQGEYFFGDSASVFVRFVSERYKSNQLVNGEVSGDHGGLGFAYRF
jgi:hypothetical protein